MADVSARSKNMADMIKTRELLQEISFQKLRVVEMEVARESQRQELGNQSQAYVELEHRAQCKEKSLILELEQSRSQENRFLEEKRDLERDLISVKQELQDVQLTLSASDGRVDSLQSNVALLEEINSTMDQQANSVLSAMRRTIGYRQESRRMRLRSPSPSRNRSGSLRRQASPTQEGTYIDCSAVEIALREQVKQLATAQRERDDAVCQLNNLSTQIEEIRGEKANLDSKIVRVQKTLADAEQNRSELGAELHAAQNAMVFQDETLRHSQTNVKVQGDKVFALERNLSSATLEKGQLSEAMNRKNSELKRMVKSVKELQNQLDEMRHQLTGQELYNKALEGDLQRVKISFTNKLAEKEVLKESVENLSKQIKTLEEVNCSLNSKIDGLKLEISKGADQAADREAQIRNLTQVLADATAKTSDLEVKVIRIQRDSNDQSNRNTALQQKYDDSRSAYDGVKKENHHLLEKAQSYQAEIQALTFRCNHLEADQRQNQKDLSLKEKEIWELKQTLTKTTRERKELQEQVAVQSLLAKMKRPTPITPEKQPVAQKTDFSTLQLEIEKAELERKVQTLQRQLSDLESQNSMRLIEVRASAQSENQLEIDRLKSANIRLEMRLETSEATSQQWIKFLEGQVNQLKTRANPGISIKPTNRSTEMEDRSSGVGSSDNESTDTSQPANSEPKRKVPMFPFRFGSQRSRSSVRSADDVISRSKESFGRFTRSYSMRR